MQYVKEAFRNMLTVLVAELFVLLQIKVRTHKRDDDDDEEERSNAVICEQCGRSDRSHRLLVCIHCDSGYDITLQYSMSLEVLFTHVIIFSSHEMMWYKIITLPH